MSTLKLFILRHGQSDLNHENIFCGWIDAKLTDKGRSQAKNAGQLIAQHCKSNGITLPQIGLLPDCSEPSKLWMLSSMSCNWGRKTR